MVDDAVVGGLPLATGYGGEHVPDVDDHGTAPARHRHPAAVIPHQFQAFVVKRRHHGDET